ncbi:MAG: bifunctional nuclease family protein, partial [Gemmatimonadaceae bacterium]
TQGYVVVLQEKGGDRLLPIWIGQAEAESIVIHMQKMKRQRPITHDLCKNLIVGMGCTLRRIEITHVEDNTYYGELHLERGGTVARIDSRPSDAIAIALRLDAPIFAAESLLVRPEEDGDEPETETYAPPGHPGEGAGLSAEQLKEYLEHIRPEDFGKFNP